MTLVLPAKEWYLFPSPCMAKSNKSIYGALIANLLIAVTKFIAGGVTNSGSMIAEGVHSLTDTVNEILLLYGRRRSHKQPDNMRPFGYGKELYFWSFIVSLLIFGLGGGISVYQGILHIIHPEKISSYTWNYAVLALSVVFEGSSLVIAIREFRKEKGNDSWWDAIIKSKDPSSFAVLFEDSAAVAGLLIVGVCMFIGQQSGIHEMDGIASVLVGLLLVLISGVLARESRSLLMGEGMSAKSRDHLKSIMERDEDITSLLRMFSIYESPDEVLLMAIVDFTPDISADEVTDAINRVKEAIRRQFPLIRYIFIQPGEPANDKNLIDGKNDKP